MLRKNRLILQPCFFKRLCAPRIPIHWIILVLEQIWDFRFAVYWPYKFLFRFI